LQKNNLLPNIFGNMSDYTADGAVEIPSVEELTSQLEAEKQARAKAEAKIVDLKKSTKVKEDKVEDKTTDNPETTGLSKEDLEAFYTEKKFFEDNADLVEYKDQISDLTKKGYSLKAAVFEIEQADETIANRRKAKQTNFTWWAFSDTKTTYSVSDFNKT